MLHKRLIISILLGLGLAGCFGGDDDDSASAEKMPDQSKAMMEATEEKGMAMDEAMMEATEEKGMAMDEAMMENTEEKGMAMEGEKMGDAMDDYTGGVLKPYDPDVPSMVVEDNNAIIYKN